MFPRRDCDICRGNGVIRLPVYQRLSVTAFSSKPPEIIEAPHRDFPCPQCAGTVTEDRVHMLTQSSVVDKRYADKVMASVRRDIAFHIAQQMLDAGLVAFTEKDDPHRLHVAVQGVVGLASKRQVATLEQRVAARQMEVAKELAKEASAGIRIWSSRYTGDEGSISKEQAVSEVQRAFERLMAERNATTE